ncbi:MAG: membrane protein insertion efficiency factor YidD [Brevinematia bacterium]
MFKFARNFFVFFIDLYKKFISPLLPSACIYKPSCSEYSREAILKFGVIKGVLLGFLRVLRCNPLFKGGEDDLTENFTIKEALRKYKIFFIFKKR